jgi:hypothetical protein
VIRETAYDYDQTVFFVSKDVGSEIVKFSFRCNASKEILINGGQDMLDELYKCNLVRFND